MNIHWSVSMVSSNDALLYGRSISHALTTGKQLARSFSEHAKNGRQVFRIKCTENCILRNVRVCNAYARQAILTMTFSVMRAYYYTHITE